MKFKCPECGEKMTVNEEAHVCECGKELSLTEANELFEDSQLIAYLDEEDSLEEGKKDKEDKDDDDGDDVEVNVDVDTDDDHQYLDEQVGLSAISGNFEHIYPFRCGKSANGLNGRPFVYPSSFTAR